VDTDQVALIGHSMGGWTVLSAAVAMPDAYQSVIVSGSSTGTFGVPAGDTSFPRNFGLVFGRFDEFSPTMWGARAGSEVGDTRRLQQQFGVTETVQPDRLYGSLANGSARMLYQPNQTHPANHITHSGVAPVIDWVQTTTAAPNFLEPSDQTWLLKETGTLLSLVGGLLFLFAGGGLLARLPLFQPLLKSPASPTGISGNRWWLAAGVFIAIPALTYFPFQGAAAAIPTSAWFGQNLTNGFMIWALGNGVISGLLLLGWHFVLGGREAGNSFTSLGLTWPAGQRLRVVALTLLHATLTVGGLYLLLATIHFLFTTDMRFWVIALKLMNAVQLHEFLVYLLPFTGFFVITGSVLHGQMRGADQSADIGISLLRNAVLMGMGIALLLAYQYLPLFVSGALAIPSQALLTIMALQFVVLLPLTGLISTWFFQLTGHVYTGALINALLITWLITAGQATHYPY
jgi:pimeloyl-ACP methyl ester carboxylesterase